uniref:Uncharacterized protein n=1 Tax=Anguilla anguilla TaxID=7936 RepID=A0A0E9XUS1_ANGAN
MILLAAPPYKCHYHDAVTYPTHGNVWHGETKMHKIPLNKS